MKTIKVRKGSAFPLSVKVVDPLIESITFLVGAVGGANVIEKTATVTNLVAVLDLDNTDTDITVGEYSYQFNLHYTGTKMIILPNQDCKDCTLPVFEVCPALEEA